MEFYTPPIGKCTKCNEYFGQPSTGKMEKKDTDFGDVFASQYFCPVCSETTDWERVKSKDLDDQVRELTNVKISEDLKHNVDGSLDYEIWQPDYKK